MSQFLGHRYCIESLRKDLVDLQGVTMDVFSRTGPVRVPSWKFPDKLSCDLDMVALLDQYDFVDGEDAFNQHSHVVLLELMIDRFLLLLHSLRAFVESTAPRAEPGRRRGGLSAGLVVRSCWTRFVQFADIKSAPQDPLPSKSDHNDPPRVNSVSCQTPQRPLATCAVCRQVQSTLRTTGQALVALLQGEGLPSSLQPVVAAGEGTLEPGQMTASDVAQWGSEQVRDMRRLAKHLQDVRGTVQPLQRRLKAAETEQRGGQSQLDRAHSELKQMAERHQAHMVQMEFSLRKAERSVRETEQRLLGEQRQLQGENQRLKEATAAQQQTLERERKALQEGVAAWQRQEDAHRQLQRSLHSLEAEASEAELRLRKEEAKYLSACRQQESMQAKLQSLLKRVEDLDEECEDLQRQLGDSEETQTNLQHQVRQVSEEKTRLQVQLSEQQELCSELQTEKNTLQTQVAELTGSMQSLKDRERTLVAFPELRPQTRPQSTGNVLLDMEQQIQANNIRIQVLEQENAVLQRCLVKLQGGAPSGGSREDSHRQTGSQAGPSEVILNKAGHD